MQHAACSLTDVITECKEYVRVNSDVACMPLTFTPIDGPPTPTMTFRSIADKLNKAAVTVTGEQQQQQAQEQTGTTIIVDEQVSVSEDPVTHAPVVTQTVVTKEIEREVIDGVVHEDVTTTTTVTTRKQRENGEPETQGYFGGYHAKTVVEERPDLYREDADKLTAQGDNVTNRCVPVFIYKDSIHNFVNYLCCTTKETSAPTI